MIASTQPSEDFNLLLFNHARRHIQQLNVSWNDLAMQLGSEYGRMIDFKRKIIQALVRVQKVYEGMRISETENGLLIKPGKLSVPLQSR